MKKLKFEWNSTTYEAYYITTAEDAAKAIKKLNANPRKLYGLDIETGKQGKYKTHQKAGLCPHLSFIRLVQIYDGAAIWVFDTRKMGDCGAVKAFVSKSRFIAHNAIFEIKHFLKEGIEVDCICSMILAQFVETAEHSPFEPRNPDVDEKPMKGFGLLSCVQRYFDLVIPKEQQISNWNKKSLSREQLVYAALDAVLPYELGKHLYPKITEYKMKKVFKLYKDMQYVIADMELNGMGIDVKAHKQLITSWQIQKVKAELGCEEYFGRTNLRSPKQLHEWVEANIDEKLKKLWPRSTKTKNFSFNKTQLQPIVHRCEALEAFMEYKKYATLLSTFGDSLQQKINPQTKRIHCSFSLGHTRTGRLSSRDPNLQNMPARGDSFRHIFVPDKGNVLVVADFSQIEIRVAGELSGDPNIRAAYRDGLDLHSAIVAELEGKEVEDVTKEERQLGKAINFGLQFGMGAKKLAFYAKTSYGVEMSENEAQRAYSAYHSRYSTYSSWCTNQRQRAKQIGWCRTAMGKVRKLADGEEYTKSVNTPVQGSAAEVMFASLIELRKELKKPENAMGIRILNTVHDEVILECKELVGGHAENLLQTAMRKGMLKIFPNTTGLSGLVEADCGSSWADAK